MMIDDPRFKFLTTKQRQIALIARRKGFIKLGEIKMFYSSREHWVRAIEKLTTFSILIPDKNSNDGDILFKRFIYNKSIESDNIQKTLEIIGK